jgi:hypothetical protein
VLGVDLLEANEEGVFLQEEQLAAIDTALNTTAGELATAQTAAQTAQAAEQAALTAQQTAEGTVAATLAALDALGPTVAAAIAVTDKVAAVKSLLAAKIANLPAGIKGNDNDVVDPENDGWSAKEKELANQI